MKKDRVVVMLPAPLQITSAVVLTAGYATSGQPAPIAHQRLGSHENPENSKIKLKSEPKFSVKIRLKKPDLKNPQPLFSKSDIMCT